MRKTLFCTLFVFVSLFTPVFSQTSLKAGYVITRNNDSISGYISDRGSIINGKKCFFKEDRNSDFIEFSPDEIAEYRYYNDKYYVSEYVWIDGFNKRVFLEFIVNGVANLYYYRDFDDGHYYIRRDDGSFLELIDDPDIVEIDGKKVETEGKKHIGLLKAYFSDCWDIQEQVDETHLNHRDLISLTTQYHDLVCPGDVCYTYIKDATEPEYTLSGHVGARLSSYSYLNTEFQPGEMQDYSISPYAGISLSRTIPQVNENFVVKMSAGIGWDHYFKEITWEYNSGSYYVDEYQLDDGFVDFSLQLEYTFGRCRIKPFIALGPVFNINFAGKDIYTQYLYVNTDEYIYDRDCYYRPNMYFGVNGQTGFEFRTNRRFFRISCGFEGLVGSHYRHYNQKVNSSLMLEWAF